MVTEELQFGMEDRAGSSGLAEAVLVPTHKKCSKKVCKNYRGSSLLSIPGKVFAKVLNNRVRRVTEDQVMEEQAGFRSGRGCEEQTL